MWTQSFKISRIIVVSAIAFLLIFGWYILPNLIGMQIIKNVVISPEINPELYSIWIHPPIPLYHKVYLFNVSNPSEILEGFPPNLTEIGPFVFRINRTKIDINFDSENDAVNYKEHNSYYFDEVLSFPWKLDQVVTLINVPFVSAAIKIEKDLIWPLSHIAHMVLLNYKEPIFIENTVEQVLFLGWKVPFLEKLEEDAGITFMPNNTFGYFAGQNDTTRGPFTVKTGVHNGDHSVGKIMEYKNHKKLNIWKGGSNSTCNKINGTDGSIFAPFIGKDRLINIFITDLCRTMSFSYTSGVNVHGIQGYRFTIPITLLEDSDQNLCFCQSGYTNRKKCLGQGVLDLGPCKDGAPVAMTQVHFLDVDTKYIGRIGDGIQPMREKHQTFLDIEPWTGTPLRVAKRIQINLILEKVSSMSGLDKVNNMLFPLLWMEESAELDEKTAEKVQEVVDFCNFVDNCGKLVAVLGSLALFFFELRKMNQLKFGQKRLKNVPIQSISSNDEKSKNCLNTDEVVALTKE